MQTPVFGKTVQDFVLDNKLVANIPLKNCPEIVERKVIELLKQSDQHAFNTLFQLFGTKIFHFAYHYLKSSEEADEIVQDVFIKVWEKRASLDADNSFSGFLFTIAHNMILNRIRKIRNDNQVKAFLAKRGAPVSNETEEQIFYGELEKIRQDALGGLPPRRKIIYQMIREDGFTHREVAERLKISIKTVESQMTEAIKHLRAKLTI